MWVPLGVRASRWAPWLLRRPSSLTFRSRTWTSWYRAPHTHSLFVVYVTCAICRGEQVFLAVVSRPCRHSTRAHRHIICLFPSLSPLARSRTITVVAMFAVLHHWCSHHHLNVPFLTTKGVALSHSLSSPIRLLFTLLGSHVSESSRLSVILLDVPCTASTLRACVGVGVWLCARRRTHNFAFTRCQSGCNGVTEQCTWVCMPLKRVSNESTSYSHSHSHTHTCPAVLRTAANRRGLRT